MQTTLLGTAIALIVALVTALVGPLLFDWTRYREDIEAAATARIGLPVRIEGPIDVRLLPTPSLDLGSISIGGPDPTASARAVRIELALGPLMRGEWRVADLALLEPRLRLRLDEQGAIARPPLTAGFDPDRFSVERFTIENGRADLGDQASGAAITLEKVAFAGDLRSLAGPIRGDGSFEAGGETYRIKIGTGRQAADGTMRLRATLQPGDGSLQIEADGTLRFESGPRFEGSTTVARATGVELANGRAIAREPWRMTAKTTATREHAQFKEAELQVGPDDRAMRLTGSADVTFGRVPHLDISIASRQLDLDRVFGLDPERRTPAGLLASMPATLGRIGSSIATTLALDIDQATLGGTAFGPLSGTVTSEGTGWTLRGLEARLAGATHLRLAGRVEQDGDGLVFSGPASLETNDPRGFLAWIEGRPADRRAPLAPLRIAGDLTLAPERVTLEPLQAEIDHKPVKGRLAYRATARDRAARLEARLSATDIDVESVLALATSAAGAAAWPREIALTLSAGRATHGTIEAKGVDAKLDLGPGGLTIERATITDLAGARVEGAGSLDMASDSPRGTLSLTVKAPRGDVLTSLLSRFDARSADALRKTTTSLGASDLKASLTVEPVRAEGSRPDGKTPSRATLSVEGKLGVVRVALTAKGTGERAALAAADIDLQGALETPDGAALATLLGAERFVSVEAKPALATLSARGTLASGLAVDAKLTAAGLSATARGRASRAADVWSGEARTSVTAADARGMSTSEAALPLTFDTKLAWTGPDLKLDDLSGKIGAATIAGQLALRIAEPTSITGRVAVSDLDLPATLANLLALPRRTTTRETPPFAVEAFGRALFAAMSGSVEVTAARATFLGGLTPAQDVAGTVRIGDAAITFERVTAKLADGALSGGVKLKETEDGIALVAAGALAGADLAQLVRGTGKTAPATGRVWLSADIAGTGRSPAALAGAMHGTGSVTVEGAELAGLDPKAIDAGPRAVERGLPLERLGAYLATQLDLGRLAVANARTEIDVAQGRVRLGPVTTTSESTEVTLTASYDVAADTLDATALLAPIAPREYTDTRRPGMTVTFRGPIATPKRTVDTSALVSWVTLRSVEQETKRVEAAEREAKRRDEQAARERAERERADREGADRERQARERAERDRIERERRATEASATAVGPPALPAPIEIRPLEVRPAPAANSSAAASNTAPNAASGATLGTRPGSRPPGTQQQGTQPTPPPAPRPFWNLFGQ